MTGRRSSAVETALRLVREGLSVSEAARQQGVAISSVRRALRAEGVPPLPPGIKAAARLFLGEQSVPGRDGCSSSNKRQKSRVSAPK